MKMPSKQFFFSALFFAVGMFLFTHYYIIPDQASKESNLLINAGISLLSGLVFAWTVEGADTYIERKNARWKARKEAEKE